jgi:hypothetical protein
MLALLNRARIEVCQNMTVLSVMATVTVHTVYQRQPVFQNSLKVVAFHFSETSATVYRSTQRNNPEHLKLESRVNWAQRKMWLRKCLNEFQLYGSWPYCCCGHKCSYTNTAVGRTAAVGISVVTLIWQLAVLLLWT